MPLDQLELEYPLEEAPTRTAVSPSADPHRPRISLHLADHIIAFSIQRKLAQAPSEDHPQAGDPLPGNAIPNTSPSAPNHTPIAPYFVDHIVANSLRRKSLSVKRYLYHNLNRLEECVG